MKSIVDQPLGDIHGVHAVALLDGVAEDNFVHGGQGVGQIEKAFEASADVVCVEHSVFGGLPHAGAVGENVGERADEHAKVSSERANLADRIRTNLLQ